MGSFPTGNLKTSPLFFACRYSSLSVRWRRFVILGFTFFFWLNISTLSAHSPLRPQILWRWKNISSFPYSPDSPTFFLMLSGQCTAAKIVRKRHTERKGGLEGGGKGNKRLRKFNTKQALWQKIPHLWIHNFSLIQTHRRAAPEGECTWRPHPGWLLHMLLSMVSRHWCCQSIVLGHSHTFTFQPLRLPAARDRFQQLCRDPSEFAMAAGKNWSSVPLKFLSPKPWLLEVIKKRNIFSWVLLTFCHLFPLLIDSGEVSHRNLLQEDYFHKKYLIWEYI